MIAGKPESIRVYMDEHVANGANYFVCSFQQGSLNNDQARRSIDLFVNRIMPSYLARVLCTFALLRRLLKRLPRLGDRRRCFRGCRVRSSTRHGK